MSILSVNSALSVLPRPKLAESMFALGQPASANGLLESPSAAEQEFLNISQKSPLERLREKILADMKVSEGDLAQMEPEARQAVEDEIKRRMMEALQASTETGAVVDKMA